MDFVIRCSAALLFIASTAPLSNEANAGRLGVCYECRAEGIPGSYYRWSNNNVFTGACGALNGSHQRAPSQLCDAAAGIVRYSPTNDPFWKCKTGQSDHNAWIGGENRDLIVLGSSDDINNGVFYRIQDGKEYSCGGDFGSGANFSALRYGRNRDIVDIFTHNGQGTWTRWTYRNQDGSNHDFVIGSNYVARLYGRNKDIIALYGIKAGEDIIAKARLIADGRGHILRKLSNTSVGLTYGRNKDINVRYCFDGSTWRTGYIGIGHGFRADCNTVLNW